MASNEGIGSPFRKQPPARFPKLHIYESLFLLNEGVDHLIILLNDLKKFPIVDEESVRCAIVDIEKSRCDMNADLTEKLADRERFDEGRFWRQRREFEKKWRDPDDVYIGVQQREEERKKKGQPSRLGVLPHSAVADEERIWEAEQERKKSAPRRFKSKG
jgi:hypothetical protein